MLQLCHLLTDLISPDLHAISPCYFLLFPGRKIDCFKGLTTDDPSIEISVAGLPRRSLAKWPSFRGAAAGREPATHEHRRLEYGWGFAASVRLGHCVPGELTVRTPGGDLAIGVSPAYALTMLGPVARVAEGTLAPELLTSA